MNLSKKIFLFGLYSYAINALFLLMELLPPVIRKLIFKTLFKNLGKNCLIDYKTYFRYPSRISIGDNVSINRGCSFYAAYMVKNVFIKIGNNVALGPHVRIFSASHDYSTYDLRDIAASVTIEDYVWIGGEAIILPGVHVGKGSVIGAGAVVSKNVPPFSVVVGNPARVIKNRTITH